MVVFRYILLWGVPLLELFFLIQMFRQISSSGGTMLTIFYTFGIAGLFTSNLYWFAYEAMIPEARMPVAANEISEWAAFLLFAEALRAEFREEMSSVRYVETILSGLFITASCALWIAWSGEWIQDILTALSFGYFVCITVRCLKSRGILSAGEWRVLGAGAYLLILGEAAVFFVPSSWKAALDSACYVWIFGSLILMAVRTLGYFRNRKEKGDAALLMAFAGWAWSLSCLYMSAEPMYHGVLWFAILFEVLVFLAVRKRVVPV